MKIYFAGNTGIYKRERAIYKFTKNRLLSFYILWDMWYEKHSGEYFVMKLIRQYNK